MDLFSTFFLRAKPWQIFLLLLGVGYGGTFINYLLVGEVSLQRVGESRLTLLAIVSGLSMFGFLSWFWRIGSFLCSIVKPALRPNAGFFGVTVAYPVLYGFAVPTLFTSANSTLSAVLLPLHLCAMACIVYDFYFVSKCLALVHAGKPKSFSDFAGTFFLLLFFPIGVWIIQPKVNHLYRSRAMLSS
jgi:type IV secretory pathway VirB3-like protein